jgi:hypothetical protein
MEIVLRFHTISKHTFNHLKEKDPIPVPIFLSFVHLLHVRIDPLCVI